MREAVNFTKGSIGKQIFIFSIPMLIGNVVQQLYSIIDGVIVGQFISGAALASVGVAMGVAHLFVAGLIGFTTGASVVISQFYGADEQDKLKRTVSTSIIFLGVLSVLIAIIGFIFTPHILRMLNTTEDIFADAVIYLRTLLVGIVFPIFYNMYTAYLRALGDAKTPLYILVVSTILNAIMNWLFVVVFGWGVGAVAVGTIIAQAFAAICCYIYTRQSMPLLRIQKLVFEVEYFKLILKYGTPAAVQLSFVTIASLTITRLINSFGTTAIAGIVAANKVDSMAMMPVSNISMALSTFVGQNMGANQEERAKKGLRSGLLIMVGIAIVLSILLNQFNAYFLSLFLDASDAHNAAILEVGSSYLDILVMFYFLFAVLFAFNGFLRGVGDAMAAMVMPVISLSIRTIAAYFLVLTVGMGPEALAWSIPIGWLISSLVSFIYYRSRRWEGKAAVKDKRQEINQLNKLADEKAS